MSEPGATVPPSQVPPPRCQRCGRVIDGTNYYRNGQRLCRPCVDQLRAAEANP